jgi:Mycobacterial cell wall arabinan synthesis protein
MPSPTDVLEAQPPTEHGLSPPARPATRVRVAEVLAFLALVAALVGALGPAERVRTTYSWPPATLPQGTPERTWYTPLLLIRHRPETISARIPCTPPPALPGAAVPTTVLATARHPENVEGLAVLSNGRRLSVAVGESLLARVDLASRGAGRACAYDVRLGPERWSLTGGPGGVTLAGVLDAMPTVTGLFSGLDLRRAPLPLVELTTAPHATRTITRQVAAWTFAFLAIVVALLLIAVERLPRSESVARAIRSALAGRHTADAVVFAALLVWWVLSPAFWDDGWVSASERMYSSSRGFSAYYDAFGTNLPLDYWLEWVQHWLVQSTNALLVLRIPSLVCLAAIWVLCRFALGRVAGASAREGVMPWALASGFLAGALAWGMTLRPEPVLALLATGVLACAVVFQERETAAPLALAAVLVPLAVTAHPAGVVSLAPLIVVAPKILAWMRRQLPAGAAVLACAIASVALLTFVGSDIQQRRADAQATVEFGLSTNWRHELIRYTSLGNFPSWGTPLRRTSVALMALALIAFVLVQRRRGLTSIDVPTAALAFALVLFIATPSKHPWHFGALIGIAAVALACEAARLRGEGGRSMSWHAAPLLVVGGTAVAALWIWQPRETWNAIDLKTLDWTPGFEQWLDLTTFAAALPVVLLVVLSAREIARGRRERLPAVPWRTASWTAPALAVPVLAFTVAVFAVDTATTESWTLARQNLGNLRGDGGCGIADDLRVAVPDSARAASRAGADEAGSLPAWVPAPPVAGLPRFVLGPSAEKVAYSPWFEGREARAGLFVAGRPDDAELDVEWGRSRAEGVEIVGSDTLTVDFALGRGSEVVPWRLVTTDELPAQPQAADSFRVALRRELPPGPALAVTAPVTYNTASLSGRLGTAQARTLVLPNVLTYFPCAQLPVLASGAVEVPQHVVTTLDGAWVLEDRETSPFRGVLDLYPLQRLPVADSSDAPRDVVAVYAVDRHVPGAMQALPERTTISS